MANRRKIDIQYFNELKNGGVVPRNVKTGKPIDLIVGKVYSIQCEQTKEVLRAKCTQDCPTYLKLSM